MAWDCCPSDGSKFKAKPGAVFGENQQTWLLLLKLRGVFLRNRGMTLTEFYQQIFGRLRDQFGRGVRDVE